MFTYMVESEISIILSEINKVLDSKSSKKLCWNQLTNTNDHFWLEFIFNLGFVLVERRNF